MNENNRDNEIMIVLTRLETKVESHMKFSTDAVQDHETRLRMLEGKLTEVRGKVLPVGGGLSGVAALVASVYQMVVK